MNEEYQQLSEEEKLRAENDFLKMKVMIEQGAQFYPGNADEKISAEIENMFLNNIIEFEEQFANRKIITVFEKIGKPQHFKPVIEIPDEEIVQAWENLSEYMRERGVELSACSPRVTERELYRFSTEELFNCETEDIKISGLMSCFIYDEFYPDDEYDNGRAAEIECVRAIFCKEPLLWMHSFADEVRLNDQTFLNAGDFKNRINRFKEIYDEINLKKINADSSQVNGDTCIVKGSYLAEGTFENETTTWAGEWLVEFGFNETTGYWYINHVRIGGFTF